MVEPGKRLLTAIKKMSGKKAMSCIFTGTWVLITLGDGAFSVRSRLALVTALTAAC